MRQSLCILSCIGDILPNDHQEAFHGHLNPLYLKNFFIHINRPF